MRIIFFKTAGTLSVQNDSGKSIMVGDDKIICPTETDAELVVDSFARVTNRLFFKEEKREYVLWVAPGKWEFAASNDLL